MKKVLYFALLTFLSFSTKAQLYCDSVLDFEPTLPDTICYSSPFVLDASLNGYDVYLWQDGTSDATYNVTAPGTYICQVTMNTGNIVENGDFEQGNTLFYTDYFEDANDVIDDMSAYTSNGQTYNYNMTSGNGMLDEFQYAVGPNPHAVHSNWTGVVNDHTSGSGNMLIVNGSSDTTANIWCQTIDVGANADYVFSAWLTSIFSMAPATFVFTINGDTIGDILVISPTVGQWNEFYVDWHSDSAQTIDICIKNQQSAANGNDFAIDDIFFGAACVQYDTILVVENPVSIFTTNDVCSSEIVQFVNSSVTNSGYITNTSWSFGNGYLSTENAPSHLYAGIGTYQVSLEVTNSYGCVGSSTSAVSINPPPSSNITTTNVLCYNGNDGSANITGVGGQGPYSYSWGFGSTDSSLNNLSIGQYLVTITDANGCTNTNNTEIFQPTILTTSAAPVNVSCFGNADGEIDLDINGGTPPYSYSWNNGNHNQDIINLIPNTYNVTVVDANGCTILETGSVTEPLEIVIIPTPNTIQCYGDITGAIDISVNGGVSPYSYNWNNLSVNEDLSNIAAGNYVLTVTDNTGCSKIQNIVITQPNPLVISLPNNFTHCNQSTDILATVEGGTTPYNYIWNDGSTTQNTQYQTNTTATYSVSVTDDHGCTAEDLIEITIISVNLEVFANKDTVCPGDPILVTTSIVGGMPPYTIYDNGNIATFPIIVYPNGIETYTLQVVDACGNTDNAEIEIYTHPIQPLSFIADILQGCPPLTVNFNQPNYSDNFDYIWTFDDNDENNLSLDYNPSHTFTESGFYDITVQSTDSNGCKNQLTITDMINVYPTPDAKFVIDEDVVSFIDAGFYFDNHSIGNYYNYWAFDDGDSSLNVNPYHNYTLPGYYYPKLIVENEFGCRDTAIKKIEVQNEFTLYVPTAFSPDYDGINDGFRAVGNGIDLDNYWIAVYDRWGELIWESNDLFEFWTGNAKGKDKEVQIGTYTWLVVCKDFNGIEHTKNGPVTVIR